MDSHMADPEGTVEPPLNQTSVDCNQINNSAKVIFVLIYSLVFLVGLILNGFTLKVYFCSAQRHRTAPNSVEQRSMPIYLKNLAAADFLMGLCIPMRIGRLVGSSFDGVFRAYCSFGATTFYLNMYASILFMGYIAMNRYLKIVHHSENHFLQTAKVAKVVSTVTWVFLLTTMTTYISLKFLNHEPTQQHSVMNTISCRSLLNKDLSLFYKIIQIYSAAVFLLTLVSLIFFYYGISRKLAAQQRTPLTSSGPEKLVKARRNMLVLVCVFCVCFVPYHLVRVPYTFLKRQCSWGQALFYLKEVTVMVSSFNVCLDPIIYFLFSKEYRATMWSSVRRQKQDTTQVELQQRVNASVS